MDGANGQGEPKVILVQELGSSSVESGGGSSETDSSTNLVGYDAPRELADHEGKVGHAEEEKDDNRDEVGPQGRQAGEGWRVN